MRAPNVRAVQLLAVVLGLVLGSAAAADWDVETVPVSGGKNAGEPAIWTNLFRHGTDTANVNWSIIRVTDSAGQNVEGNGFGGNPGFSSTGGSVAANCSVHGIASRTRQAGWMIDWEGWLQTAGALPGTYRLTVSQSGDAVQVIRNHLIQPQTVPITIRCVDSVGQPIQGLSVSVSQPYSEAWGVTDALGKVTVSRGRQWYRANITGTGYRQLTPTFSALSEAGVVATFTMASTGEPVPAATGGLQVLCRDATTLLPIRYATVTHQGQTATTSAEGWASFSAVPTGSGLSVTAAKSGYSTTGATVAISAGNVTQLVLNLPRDATWQSGGDQDPPPGGSSGGSGEEGWGSILSREWWGNLFSYLFVPGPECVESWEAFFTQVKSWGPFAVVGAVFYEWAHPGWVSGEHLLCWDVSFSFFGNAGASTPFCLDLRPQLGPEDPPYPEHPESRGSIGGNWIAWARTFLGVVVWGLWAFGLYKLLIPRLSW